MPTPALLASAPMPMDFMMTKPPNLPIQAKPWSMVQSQAPEFMITEPAVRGGARLLPGAAPRVRGHRHPAYGLAAISPGRQAVLAARFVTACAGRSHRTRDGR